MPGPTIAVTVDQAIVDGKIVPKNRAAWIRRIKKDPKAATTMASLAPALDTTSTADALYNLVKGK